MENLLRTGISSNLMITAIRDHMEAKVRWTYPLKIAKFPLDVVVRDIEADRISLPTVNSGVKGEKPLKEASIIRNLL